MGKEYWYWGGKSSKRGQGVVDREATSSAGCMCAVFQLFDFHNQFQFANLNHHHHHHHQPPQPASFKSTFLPEDQPNSPIKGVEAPRNSLKSEEETSLSSIIEEEEEKENLNLNIQMGIQIKTNGGSRSSSSSKAGGALSDFSSDTSSSPGTKTPGLVARLMGLDLLPETNSPTFTPSTIQSNQSHLKRLPLRPRQPQLQTKARHYIDTSTDHNSSGTRSLPETPRISSARRSDVDYHHRLSLQINKENNNVVGFGTEDLDFSKLSALRRKQLIVHEDQYESSKSPGHYARQIVKQVKEGVSRRVGLDITNTCRNRDHYNQKSRDELVKQLKSKKVSKGLAKLDNQVSRGKNYSSSIPSNNSCSPRLRFSTTDSKSTGTTTPTTPTFSTSKDQSFQLSTPLLITSSTSASPALVKVSAKSSKSLQERGQQETTSFQKSRSTKKAGREGFGPRLQKIQEDTFVRSSTATRTNIPDKKCKKTPLSNNILNLNVPTLLSVKKTPISPKQPPGAVVAAAEVSHNAQESKRRWSQLSSSQSQKYQPKTKSHVLEPQDTTTNDVVVVTIPNGTTSTRRGGWSDLNQYVSRILFRTGIAKTSHVSFTNWFSPSHPLDPSIFHRLENSFYLQDSTTFTNLPPQFRLRSNRRLVFDVVDEILVDILRPYMNLKPWINSSGTRGRSRSSSSSSEFWIMHGSQLIDTLCLKVESFPSKDCQVLEDIDGLIDRDLPKLKIQSEMAFEEEGEGLVMEIERDILDTLVHETTLMLMVETFTH